MFGRSLFTSVRIEGEHLVEAQVVDDAVAEGRGGAHLLAHMARLVVEFRARGAPAFRSGVVDFGGLYLLVVLQPAGDNQFVMARASWSEFGAIVVMILRVHGDDGPLAPLEEWGELLPRPGDGIEHAEANEVAFEGANPVHHESRSCAAEG